MKIVIMEKDETLSETKQMQVQINLYTLFYSIARIENNLSIGKMTVIAVHNLDVWNVYTRKSATVPKSIFEALVKHTFNGHQEN